MTNTEKQLLRAAGVIALTPAIRAYLTKNDPKALEQLEGAIRAASKPRRPLTGRAKMAADLWMRLVRGPSFGIGEAPIEPAEITDRYRGWASSWILDNVARLVPELRDKLDSTGYVRDEEKRVQR